jgi:outer membrane protein
MRFEKVMVVLALAALLAWGLGAKNDRMKVGVFDADRAVSSTKEGRAAREELDRKVRAAQAQLAPLGERFEEMRKELEAKKFVLSEEARFQKQLDLAELRNQIENKQKEMEGQLKVDHERLLAPLRQKLTEGMDGCDFATIPGVDGMYAHVSQETKGYSVAPGRKRFIQYRTKRKDGI